MFEISLRPHHLLCILTYNGRGYNEAFTDNLNAVIVQMNGAFKEGESVWVHVVGGPDAICAPLSPRMHGYHCNNASERDAMALRDINVLLQRMAPKRYQQVEGVGPLVADISLLSLTEDLVTQFRKAFVETTVRSACIKGNCPWQVHCTTLGANGFQGAQLQSPAW